MSLRFLCLVFAFHFCQQICHFVQCISGGLVLWAKQFLLDFKRLVKLVHSRLEISLNDQNIAKIVVRASSVLMKSQQLPSQLKSSSEVHFRLLSVPVFRAYTREGLVRVSNVMQDGSGPRMVTKLLLINWKSVCFPDLDSCLMVTTKSIAVWKNCKDNCLERALT